MKIQPVTREFTYNGAVLPDPDPSLTPHEVRNLYAPTYPELATAAIEGPEEDGAVHRYAFRRAVGAKG